MPSSKKLTKANNPQTYQSASLLAGLLVLPAQVGFKYCRLWWQVLFGKDILVAAERNLRTETGLSAQLRVCGVAHFKDMYHGQLVQDKFFFIVHATQPIGDLLPSGPTGKNLWLSMAQLHDHGQVLQGVVDMMYATQSSQWEFIEATHVVTNY